ncbi:peptidase [Chryseobacterium sp. T16E-39]|uniref:T9SS type A sorting domain-containing protein n=1 Tax=Chryseobacterium sp. T16E-39 TaxID=2015076 RepID=UPI000B5B12D1|nr:T9SS type A sorting domain-containing protein [Chryseobacterium sp. T16E-39]ASK29494.1 peptidase [Chryseobacterium sp. T16E-39]
MKLKINSLVLGCLLSCSTFMAQESSLKVPAQKWINENSRNLGIKSDQMMLSFVRKGNSGETLRFQQFVKDVPVFQSEIIIHFNKEGKITYTSTENLKKDIKDINTVPSINASDALQKAHIASKTKGKITLEENKLFVYSTPTGDTKLVYRVLTSSHDNPGSWQTIVDAENGNVISVEDIALYHHDKNEEPKPGKKNAKKEVNNKKVFVSGSGYIFNPDPLSKMQVAYGGQYVDNNDATNASLDAARTLVTIPELDFAGGMYKLKGSYAEIKELETPSTGLFTQATNQFLFNRNDQGFEAVNAYWHIDNSLRYINETLNIVCKPLTNDGILWYDPHGVDGDDNSYYSNGRLVFGEGCVDDAEDADVILHELGHGVHDWITNGNLSQVQGLSEGCGDYWAQSYSRSLNQWPSSAPQYNWMFSWDGHNTCWAGRITNYTVLYPGTGAIHTRGQIWASALMRIYDQIGRAKTDRAFLEGLAATGAATNQQQAAIAVRQAAIDMLGQFGFNCGDIAIMTQEFTAAGYTLPAYSCQLSVDDVAPKELIAIYPNPVNDILTVSLKLNKEEKVEIYNMEGRKVLEKVIGNGKNKIDVSALQTGNYMLNIKEMNLSTKFIKK